MNKRFIQVTLIRSSALFIALALALWSAVGRSDEPAPSDVASAAPVVAPAAPVVVPAAPVRVPAAPVVTPAASEDEFTGSVQLGVQFVDGNSFLLGVINNINLSFRRKANAVELLSRISYGQIGVQAMGGPVQQVVTSAFLWWLRPRYDRYFLGKNSLYVAFGGEGNFRAGIDHRLEAMAGYARTLWRSPRHLLRAELGYAFTYEVYVAGVQPSDGQFDDARLGVRYALKLRPQLGLFHYSEVFWSLNQLERVRINSLTSLDVGLWKMLTLHLNFKAKINTAPPNRPPLMSPLAAEFAQFDPYDVTLDAMLGFSWS